jgi:site-specific DNA recombinase
MSIGIYVRVSTQEQATEGYSIAAQKERLKAFCVAQGWDDFKFYVDEGVSAKDTNRPQLAQLLEHIKNGQINILLVYRLDRLTRRVKDLYTLLETLEKYKCTFKSATEPYDTATAMGRMFIGLVALLAQWETENLSERIKMALEEKVSNGERVGAIPFGFDLSRDETLIKNEKAPIVLDIIEKLKSGMSSNAIADFLNTTNNDRQWRANTVLRLLKNPAIYGATKWNDQIYENTHEGLISKTEFIKLQQILEDRSVHPRREVENTYLFQGVLSCPVCDRPLSVNRYIRKRKNDDEFQNAIYRCQICRKEGKFNLTIGEHRFLSALYEYMKNVEIKDVELVEEQSEREIYVEQLKQIEKKREKYQKGWAADLISDEEFEKRMNETKGIYAELKKKLESIKSPVIIDTEAIKNIIFRFNQTFSYLTQEEKRFFIAQFIRKIEFKLIPQPPTDKRNKKGKDLVVFTDVLFY